METTYPDDIVRPLFLNVIVQKDHKFTPAENGQGFYSFQFHGIRVFR